MKMFNRVLFGCSIGALLCMNASALTITPAGVSLVLSGEEKPHGVPDIELAIDAYLASVGSECVVVDVYKGDPKDGETSVDYVASYETVFSLDPAADEDEDDPDYRGATITWEPGTLFIDPVCTYLLIKDGNHSPWWYFFDLAEAGWDGKATLELSGFWPGAGSISHVSIYDGGTTSVPDGGATMALLGISVILLSLISRKKCDDLTI